ncbi:hypothetical protein QN353_21370, partial [Undibacterium sp. 10I3]
PPPPPPPPPPPFFFQEEDAIRDVYKRQTADRLIADKISKGDWAKHLGESPSLFVNAATWGLLVCLLYTS